MAMRIPPWRLHFRQRRHARICLLSSALTPPFLFWKSRIRIRVSAACTFRAVGYLMYEHSSRRAGGQHATRKGWKATRRGALPQGKRQGKHTPSHQPRSSNGLAPLPALATDALAVLLKLAAIALPALFKRGRSCPGNVFAAARQWSGNVARVGQWSSALRIRHS